MALDGYFLYLYTFINLISFSVYCRFSFIPIIFDFPTVFRYKPCSNSIRVNRWFCSHYVPGASMFYPTHTKFHLV